MNSNTKFSSVAPTEADKVLNRLLIELLRPRSLKKTKHAMQFTPQLSNGSMKLSKEKDHGGFSMECIYNRQESLLQRMAFVNNSSVERQGSTDRKS